MNEWLAQIAEMQRYFAECAANAAPGSEARKRFTGYLAALNQFMPERQPEQLKQTKLTRCVCGALIVYRGRNVCPKCGRAVNWECV